MDNKFHWILDAGHGGLNPKTKEYQTKGKRSPIFPCTSKYNGEVLYEGVRNRKILHYLTDMLSKNNLSYTIVSDKWRDISLTDRVMEANKIAETKDNCIYLSIHHNAYGKNWNNASGLSTYHFPKSEKGYRLAMIFQDNIVEEIKWRDRGIKSANFYVLKYTKMPSVLTENGFMTNLKEAEFLMNDDVSYKIALSHFKSIKEVNERGLKFL